MTVSPLDHKLAKVARQLAERESLRPFFDLLGVDEYAGAMMRLNDLGYQDLVDALTNAADHGAMVLDDEERPTDELAEAFRTDSLEMEDVARALEARLLQTS